MDERLDDEPVRIPSLPLARAVALLSPPEVPGHAAADVALARAAGEAGVPLLLVAPTSARRLALVRALHAVAHRPGPIFVWTGGAPSPALQAAGATVVIDTDVLAPHEIVVLETLLDEPTSWLVCLSDDPGHLPPALAARLHAAMLTVPALARRVTDVPALAEAVLQALCERAARPPSSLTAEAAALLSRHTWPGGRVELEGTLSRAMLLAGPGGAIDASVLDFGARAAAEATADVADVALVQADGAAVGPRLEYLLAELAHELRNPLVTVKTFAQQLPALLEDEALRTRFAELTDEAVTRMDTLLENVLAFARLPPPHVEDLDVGVVLDGVLGDVTPALDERDVRIRIVGDGARCSADREHLSYALRNLLVGIAHESPPREELVVDASVNGVVSLRFGTGAAVTRLRDLATPDQTAALDDPTFLPLAFTLARAVLERTGGHLGVVPSLGGQATVTVRLPPSGPTDITR